MINSPIIAVSTESSPVLAITISGDASETISFTKDRLQ